MSKTLGRDLAIAAVALAVVFATQYIYEEPLFQYSKDTLIPALQESVPPNSVSWDVWWAYTHIGGSVLQILWLVTCMMLYPTDPMTFALLTNFNVQIFLINFFKMFHHNPRPFWINTEIHPATCYTQFGNPSGHSVCAIYFSMYLFF